MAFVRETEKQALQRWNDLELLQEHYKDFSDFVVDVIEGVMGFNCTDVQLDIANYLATGPKRRMIQAQRGQAKTTITACYAVWRMIHDPTTRVLVVSAGEDQASEIAGWIIQILNNMEELECMRADRAAGDRSSITAYDIHYTLKGPEKSPSVACIGITANMQGKRADLLIADDIESAKNSATAVMRARLHHLTLDFTSICSTGDIVYLGTPQSIDSEYNTLPGRGYEIRIWPGRYPTAEEIHEYNGMLAPMITAAIAANPALQTGGGPMGNRGKVIDPVLLNEDTLTQKEIDQGSAYFQLQHMLSTHLSDANRFPLKLNQIRFCNFDTQEKLVPMTMTHMQIDQFLIQNPEGASYKDRMYRINDKTVDDYGPIKYLHMYVDPTGGGTNGDELAYAVTGWLAGRVFVFDCGGRPGGLNEESAKWIVGLINKWKPKKVDIEKNYGNGAFANILRPLLRDHIPEIEDVWEAGQKELRIIDVLEPIIGGGKLVMHESIVTEDWQRCLRYPTQERGVYSLFWQMSRITRARDAITHDDRLDALAGSCRHWIELLQVDDEKAKAAAKNEQYKKMMQNPLGNGRPMPGWSGMHGLNKNGSSSLSKFGLSGHNPMRRI